MSGLFGGGRNKGQERQQQMQQMQQQQQQAQQAQQQAAALDQQNKQFDFQKKQQQDQMDIQNKQFDAQQAQYAQSRTDLLADKTKTEEEKRKALLDSKNSSGAFFGAPSSAFLSVDGTPRNQFLGG
mgnify:CR=1 FL=1